MAINGPTNALDERKITQAAATLKPRRKVLLASLMAGNTVAKSSQIARYSHPNAGREAIADMRRKLPELMEAVGMSTPDILRKLRKKLDAQKTITANWNGEITDIIEVDDNGIQMDAIKLSLRLHGLLASDSADGPSHLNISITNTVDVNKDEE
jgi:hypothetical protein